MTKKVAKKKPAKKGPDKRKLVSRLVEPPKKAVGPWWGKEMALFKRLLESYPDLEFWKKVEFPGLRSMAQLTTWPLDEQVRNKYDQYRYVVPKKEVIEIGKTVGNDIIFQKKITLKDFLNGKKEERGTGSREKDIDVQPGGG
jgi:hypothetical protein